MDSLDIRILKVLLSSNSMPPEGRVLRKSFRLMAKELEVDEATVRRRMRKFQEQRVLKGWYLGVHPGLMGFDVGHAWFRAENESAKGDLIDKLLSVPDVERVCSHPGGVVSAVLVCRNPGVIINRLAEGTGTDSVLYKKGVVQVRANPVKKMDLDIITSLRQDPWKPYSAVSDELGVSARTVKRKVTRLSEEGSIYLLPVIDHKTLQGILSMQLYVEYASPDSRIAANERISSHVNDALVFAHMSESYGVFVLTVGNVYQVEQITRWVREQKGVKEANALVLEEAVLNRNHYENWRESEKRGNKVMASTEVV